MRCPAQGATGGWVMLGLIFKWFPLCELSLFDAMDLAEAWQRGAAPRSRPGEAAGRSYPTTEVRGGGREEQPHIQGAVAVRTQEGLEELLHVQGQEGQHRPR